MAPRNSRIEVISPLGCQVGLATGKPCGKPASTLTVVIEINVCQHHAALFLGKGPSALSLLIVEKVSLGPTNHPRLLS